MLDFLILCISILILSWGSVIAVDCAVKLAQFHQLSYLFTGLIILSIGSNLPELVVTISASLNSLSNKDMSGIIIATPIWWGMFSSHTQALIERLDYIDTWSLDDNHYKPMFGKVMGTIVSGGVDGWQHITGTLASFASNLALTMPPLCNIESEAQG